MANDGKSLIDSLRNAGFSAAAISAAWPSWWTEEAEESPSGRAELRFALARRLPNANKCQIHPRNQHQPNLIPRSPQWEDQNNTKLRLPTAEAPRGRLALARQAAINCRFRQ